MTGSLAAAAVVVLALLAGCAGGVPDAEGRPELRLVQLNLCGYRNALPDGCEADGRTPGERLTGFARFLAEVQPHVVTLNEVCGGDVARIRAEATAAGWPLDAVFHANSEGSWLACEGQQYGIAVLVHGTVAGEARPHPLSTPASPELPWEERSALCTDANITGRAGAVTVCSTHLTPGTFGQDEHDALVAAMATERRRAPALVLGGDLNDDPRVVRPLLAAAGLGDRARRGGTPATYHRRHYDYLFTTDDLGERTRVEARDVASTDHRALVLRISS